MTRQSFLELDSSYRNRNLDPKVSDFTVTLSQSGIKSQANAIDPVSNAYPVNVFNFKTSPVDVNTVSFNKTLTLDSFLTTPSVVNTSSTTVLVLWCSTDFGTQSGTFTGSVLVYQSSDANGIYRRITDWKYYKTVTTTNIPPNPPTIKYYYKVSIESAFSTQPLVNTTFLIQNPSDFTDTAHPYIFLPSSLAIPNYYNKYILYNQTKNESVNIVSYDMDTHLAQLGDITNKNSWTLNGATGPPVVPADTYVVREEAPVQIGSANANGTNTSVPVGTAFFSNHASSFYTNAFIRFTSGNNINAISKIIKTNEVLATSKTPATPPSVLFVNPLVNAVQNGDAFEILQYSSDNYSPFVYTGTLSSNSQPVAHEISLNSLTLPNIYLKSGGRIAYYPYVYVVLENVSSTSGNPKNLIYSNNPNNYKAVFRAPITDLNHPNNSPFVKLTGNGMKQTMVFKQNDDVHVSILLPNGNLFEPISQDNPVGQTPNPLLQTSVLFSMERIQ